MNTSFESFSSKLSNVGFAYRGFQALQALINAFTGVEWSYLLKPWAVVLWEF